MLVGKDSLQGLHPAREDPTAESITVVTFLLESGEAWKSPFHIDND